jgi:hypothetical protein
MPTVGVTTAFCLERKVRKVPPLVNVSNGADRLCVFDNRLEPAVLEISGLAGIVAVSAFLGSVAFTHISCGSSKGGAMKTALNFIDTTFKAFAVVASAVLANVTASALLPQAGFSFRRS